MAISKTRSFQNKKALHVGKTICTGRIMIRKFTQYKFPDKRMSTE